MRSNVRRYSRQPSGVRFFCMFSFIWISASLYPDIDVVTGAIHRSTDASEPILAGTGHSYCAHRNVAAFNPHNSFLNMMINAGVIGLILTLIWVTAFPHRYIKEAESTDDDPILTLLHIRLWLYGLYMSCMKNTFFQNGGALWFCIMIAVFGTRLQAKARVD